MPRPLAVTGFSLFFTLLLLFYLGERAAYILLLCCLPPLLVFGFRGKKRNAVYAAAAVAVLAGCVLFLLQTHLQYRPALEYSGETLAVTGELTQLPQRRNGKIYYLLQTETIDGKTAVFSVRLTTDEVLDAQPLDTVSATVTFYTLGIYDGEMLDRYRASGTYLGAYPAANGQRDDEGHLGNTAILTAPSAKKPLRRQIIRLYGEMLETVRQKLPGEDGALVCALLLGDTTGLSYQTNQDFSRSGIAHITSVSGLHLSVWAVVLFALCAGLGLSKRLSALLSAVFILLFMLLVGAGYAVTRAGLMLLILMAGHVFSREADSLNNLGFAMLVICGTNPFAAGSSGLQLSFAATLGMLLLTKRLEAVCKNIVCKKFRLEKLWRVLRPFAGIVCTTTAATLATLPLSIFLFGSFPLLSVPVNLLVLHASSFAMICGALCTVFPAQNAFGAVFASAAGIAARYIRNTAHIFANLPFSVLRTNSHTMLLWLAGAFLLAAAGVAAVRQIALKKNAPREGKRHLRRMTALLCVLTFLCAVTMDYGFNTGSTLVTVVDVDGGMAVIVSRGDCALLLLSGTQDFYFSSKVSRALQRLQITVIDALLLPHNGRSENETAAALLTAYSAGQVYAYHEAATLEPLLSPQTLHIGQEGSLTLWEDTKLHFYAQAILLESAGTCLLLLPRADAQTATLPQDWKEAQAVFCRGTPPKGLDYRCYALTVISAAGEKGLAEQSLLCKEGANAAATASQGDIILRLQRAKVSAERAEK